MDIYCENDYCIYYKEKKCALNKIEIGFGGLCESCILVRIPEQELEHMREEQLRYS